MRISIRQEHDSIQRALGEASWQEKFPEDIVCEKCISSAIPIMVFEDEEGLIASQEEFVESPTIWPHDSLSIVVYICRNCGEMFALWNQA